MIEIRGFIDVSFLDWDGKICSVIFLPGCNFRCLFCHSGALILSPQRLKLIPLIEVETHLKKYSEWLDGLVISGGEPTIYPSLPQLIEKIKKLKIAVKLDTNGTNPQMLEELIKKRLIDYVAMDIKTSLVEDKYRLITGREDLSLARIKQSISLLKKGKIDYEFRMTVVPSFHHDKEIEELARSLAGSKKLVLQQFNPTNALSVKLRKVKPYPREIFIRFLKICQQFNLNCQLRGV
jgi:pyruvate formate lyase activating enzyme